jgi:TolA-binding protein
LRAICLCGLLTVAVVARPAHGQPEKDTKAAAATRAKKLQAKVTVTFDDTPLKEVLEELKSQVEAAATGSLSFKLESGVSMNQKITFTAKDKTLEQVLTGIFTKVGLGYYVLSKEKDRYDGWVVVKPGKERGYPEGQEPKAVAEKAPAKAAAKAKPAAKEKAEAGDKDEQAAASKLNLAKDLADNGKTEKARERYQDIIRLYPKTKAAEEARELLDKLKKK